VDVDHFLRHENGVAHAQGCHLNLAGALQRPHLDEHPLDGLVHHHRAMIAQHQDGVIAKVAHQPLTFFRAHGHAFKIVITDLPFKIAGVEIGRHQPVLVAGDRHCRRGVDVADCIGAAAQMLVKIGVLGKARLVHHIGRTADIIALDIDLDEVRCGHFAIQQAERVDQEGIFLPRHLQRNVVVD